MILDLPVVLSVVLVLTLIGVGVGSWGRAAVPQSTVQVAVSPMGKSSHDLGPWNRGSWPSWGQAPVKPVVRAVARPKPRQARNRPVAAVARPHVHHPVPQGGVAGRIAAAWPGTNDYEAVAVARCESGLNPYAVGGGGTYVGLFQADSSFRASYGYGPSVEAQTMMAWRGYQARGWQPWPNCGAARFGYR